MAGQSWSCRTLRATSPSWTGWSERRRLPRFAKGWRNSSAARESSGRRPNESCGGTTAFRVELAPPPQTWTRSLSTSNRAADSSKPRTGSMALSTLLHHSRTCRADALSPTNPRSSGGKCVFSCTEAANACARSTSRFTTKRHRLVLFESFTCGTGPRKAPTPANFRGWWTSPRVLKKVR